MLLFQIFNMASDSECIILGNNENHIIQKKNESSHHIIQNGHLIRDESYHCDKCNKFFSLKCSLTKHKRTHTGNKPHKCSQCDKVFRTKNQLVCHMMNHTGEKPYQCSFCSKSYMKNHNLQYHIMSHTGERPYPCSLCDKTFRLVYQLSNHMRIHTGEKPYRCSYCGKSFNFQSNLDTHNRSHTGEKPYSCSQCNKSFPTYQQLSKHMRTHTGEKPYQCSYCDKSCSIKANLEIHIRKHTGEKPFPCSQCDKAFSQKGQLKIHMKKHTGECSNYGNTKDNQKSSGDINEEEINKIISNKHRKKVSALEFYKLKSCDERDWKACLVNTDKYKQSESSQCESEDPIVRLDEDNVKEELQLGAIRINNFKFDDESEENAHVNTRVQSKLIQSEKVNEIYFEKKKTKNLNYESKSQNSKDAGFEEDVSREQTGIEEVALSDSDEECDRVVIQMLSKEKINSLEMINNMQIVLSAISNVFDLLEESSEGAWTRNPNQTENDLYDVLQSFKLERFEDSSYSSIHNLDVNYRQLYIIFSGVDGMVLKHALLCKDRYPDCRDIPCKHQEDMSCCI